MPRDRQQPQCQCGGRGETVYRDRQTGNGATVRLPVCLYAWYRPRYGERGRETLEKQTTVRGVVVFLGQTERDRQTRRDRSNRQRYRWTERQSHGSAGAGGCRQTNETGHLPYRTFRWEWMMRLASSGVRSSRLGLPCESDMDQTGLRFCLSPLREATASLRRSTGTAASARGVGGVDPDGRGQFLAKDDARPGNPRKGPRQAGSNFWVRCWTRTRCWGVRVRAAGGRENGVEDVEYRWKSEKSKCPRQNTPSSLLLTWGNSASLCLARGQGGGGAD